MLGVLLESQAVTQRRGSSCEEGPPAPVLAVVGHLSLEGAEGGVDDHEVSVPLHGTDQ